MKKILAARFATSLVISMIAGTASAQPNVFLMVDIAQAGGPSAVQSSVGYSRNTGASYSDTSMSASASKSKTASSEKQTSGYAYRASAAAAASNGRSSAAARASVSGAGASSYKSSTASSQSSASVAKANVQYEQHDNVSYGQTVYAQTGGDNGLSASEALSTLASSLLQLQVDVTYPEMLLGEFFNDNQPTIDFVRKSSKYPLILQNLAGQSVGYFMGVKMQIKGTGGTVSNYGCQGTLSATLQKTMANAPVSTSAVSGSARGNNLEDCQRNLVTQLSDTLAVKIRPSLGE